MDGKQEVAVEVTLEPTGDVAEQIKSEALAGALKRLQDREQKLHNSHYTKHSSHSVKHSSTW